VRVADFDYELDPERIAQRPPARRDRSKLLVLDRDDGAIGHHRFDALPELLNPGDLLVLNDTRVIPARLVGRKPTGGRIEIFLVAESGADGDGAVWRCLVRATRKPAPGSVILLDDGLAARVLDRDGDHWRVRLEAPDGRIRERIERVGRIPLPPYIHRPNDEPDRADRERYQTVYARKPGAVAAPTAGLHFTEALFERLDAAGVERTCLTLHVGPGTFLPVRGDHVEQHRMHEEAFEIPPAVVAAVSAARRRGGRVVAVGTTVVRALEAAAGDDGRLRPGAGRSDLFIVPGYRFRVADALVTNFHLPRSTLLMLVCAFGGSERVLAAYREAQASDYRFYSYGDAMLITSR